MAQGHGSQLDEWLAGYHRYRELEVTAAGQAFRVVTKPGVFSWQRLHDGTRLLVERMQVGATDTVLDLGCGYGAAGLVAAGMAPRGQVYLVDSNVAAAECARRTLALNGVEHARVLLGDGVAALPETAFDVVISHLPRGREVARQFIVDAARVLKPGGRFYLAGHNKAGIKSFVSYAQEVFGNGEILAYKKSCRVACCIKDDRTTVSKEDLDAYYRWREFTVKVGGRAYRVVSKPGVFAWNKLDPGTQMLVETMEVGASDTVLDLGCGYGIIGLAAAARARQVYLVDSNVVAVEAAGRTLALNGVPNAEARASDGAEAVRDLRFDVVATNPPFHQGRQTDYTIANQFFYEAAQVLQPAGRLYVVANRFIRYERQMERHFVRVSVAREDNLYRVLLAEQPRKSE